MFAMITKRIATVALIACLAVGSSSASAGLIFSVAKTSPAGDVPPGSATAAVFGVFVRSDVPNQSFLGADFALAISSASGAGGRYVAGTNDLLVPGAGGFIGSPFTAPGSVAVNFSSLANTAVTLGTTDTLLATLTLSTAGAEVLEGNYSMTLSGLDAVDSGFNQIATASAGPVNYTITAVPEPTTIASLGIAAGVAGIGIARKKLRRAAGSKTS